MARHPASHRVNAKVDFSTIFLQQLSQLFDHVLGLGHRHTVCLLYTSDAADDL